MKASIVFFIVGFLIVGSKLSGTKKDSKKQVKKQPVEQQAQVIQTTTAGSTAVVKSPPKPLTKNEEIEQETKLQSKKFHPFYKVSLSISGFADYFENGRRVKYLHLSASQYGQHVFTTSTRELMMAGYNVQVFGECAVKIEFFNYKDFLTCNAPTQSVNMGGQKLASGIN